MTKRNDLSEASIGTCENCETERTKVRPVEAFSVMQMGREPASRGFYTICYKCFRPRVFWKDKMYGDMSSPMRISDEELNNFMIVDIEQ